MRNSQIIKIVLVASLLACTAAIGQVSIRVNNIVTVAATGDATQNGDALLNLLNSIGDSGPSNPYQVKLEPGDYLFGSGASVIVPSYVTVTGTGLRTTVIRGTADGALINLEDGAELQFLTVRNEGDAAHASTYAVGLGSDGQALARVVHIRAEALQAQTDSAAFLIANTDANASIVELVVHDSYGSGETATLNCQRSGLGVIQFSSDDSQLVTDGTTPPLQSGCEISESRCIGSYDSEYDPVSKPCFPPPVLPTTVFVTSSTSNGDFGFNGLASADVECQGLADVAALGGTWVAWLSNSSEAASTRLTTAGALGPYRRTDGTIVADSLPDLTDSFLDAPINRDEFGTPRNDSGVWTGTLSDGSAASSVCNDWNPDGGGAAATIGSTSATGSPWTAANNVGCGGGNSLRLYCFRGSD